MFAGVWLKQTCAQFECVHANRVLFPIRDPGLGEGKRTLTRGLLEFQTALQRKVTSVVSIPSRLWPTPRWWSKWSRTLVQWYWTSWLSWRPPWLRMSLRRHWRFGPLEEHSVNITIHLRLSLSLSKCAVEIKGKVCPCLAFLLFLFFFPSELQSEFT